MTAHAFLPTPCSVTPTARAAADEVACGVGSNGGLNDRASVEAGMTVLLLDRPVWRTKWRFFGLRLAQRPLAECSRITVAIAGFSVESINFSNLFNILRSLHVGNGRGDLMSPSSSNALSSQSGNQADHWHGRVSRSSGSLKDRFRLHPKEVSGRVCFGKLRDCSPQAEVVDYLLRMKRKVNP